MFAALTKTFFFSYFTLLTHVTTFSLIGLPEVADKGLRNDVLYWSQHPLADLKLIIESRDSNTHPLIFSVLPVEVVYICPIWPTFFSISFSSLIFCVLNFLGEFYRLHKKRLEAECDHISPLQSWGPELRHFVEIKERPLESDMCDAVIEKPAIVMKIDASKNHLKARSLSRSIKLISLSVPAVSMYHHFCDFLNLYASLHLNGTHSSMFSNDVTIMIWETMPYQNNFDVVMKTFTNQPVLNLRSFSGKTVCFKNLVLPLLPRMIFGLYYNTPIVSMRNCISDSHY